MSPSDRGVAASAHSTTSGMVGGGFYDANSATQWNAIEAVLPFLDKAAGTLPIDGSGPIGLADFGCSEGRNSIAVMQRALHTLMPRTNRSVQTIHSDLPTNDFSNLFLNLRKDGKSVFTGDWGSDRVFSAAVGGSMYDQLLPERSLHLATTFNAIGFLSRRPVPSLPGYILPNGPSATRNNGFVAKEDRIVFADQAKQDVGDFLQRRARELVPGGMLLVQVFGGNDFARTCDGLYDLLNDAALDFKDAGEISEEVYDRYYQPVYMRSLDELTLPVTDSAYGAAGLFEIEDTKSYEIAVPFTDRFRADGDLETYALDYVNFFRAFTQAVLAAALPDTPDRATLVDRIYARAVELLKAHPERYPFRYVAVAMLLKRTG